MPRPWMSTDHVAQKPGLEAYLHCTAFFFGSGLEAYIDCTAFFLGSGLEQYLYCTAFFLGSGLLLDYTLEEDVTVHSEFPEEGKLHLSTLHGNRYKIRGNPEDSLNQTAEECTTPALSGLSFHIHSSPLPGPSVQGVGLCHDLGCQLITLHKSHARASQIH